MITKLEKLNSDKNKELLNALLQKAGGDISNLSSDELRRLQQLCTQRMLEEYARTLMSLYPGVPMISAALREEMHQRRTSQKNMAGLLGCTYPYLNKVLMGYNTIGMPIVKKMYQYGFDGNFIIENLGK